MRFPARMAVAPPGLQKLVLLSGGAFDAREVAYRIGVAPCTARRRAHRLEMLAVRFGRRMLYPAWQVLQRDGMDPAEPGAYHVPEGLGRVLRAFPSGTDPWVMLGVLLAEDDSGCIIDWIRQYRRRRIEHAVRIARSHAWRSEVDAMIGRMQTPSFAAAARRALDEPLRAELPGHLRRVTSEGGVDLDLERS